MTVEDVVRFQIQGIGYTVGSELAPNTTLNDYIRDYAGHKGTKFMCVEGGCGSCVVAVERIDPVTKESVVFAVNSCLIPVFSCHGWDITTVEGLGNRKEGYHRLQTTLASFNGTQCGYCTPGMLMSMYSTSVAQDGKFTMRDVETALSGNICRCTGYRPILNAFQSMSVDAPKPLKQKFEDIEDVNKDLCKKTGQYCVKSCGKKCVDPDLIVDRLRSAQPLTIKFKNGNLWFRVTTLREISEIFSKLHNKTTYTLVAGNTAHGVYRSENQGDVHIDINGVTELHEYKKSRDQLVMGANVTLNSAIEIFRKVSTEDQKNFGYLSELADHLELVANTPVRNVATLAGNLSIKHDHNDFPSDVFLILEAADARLQIDTKFGITHRYGLLEYLKLDMKYRVIRAIALPAYSSADYIYRSFKIMKRSQNTPAYGNAAFRIKVDKKKNYKILERPSLVFGGISSSFVHANETEVYLVNKSILDPETLKTAYKKLFAEIQPDNAPLQGSPQYRKNLAVSLFYKFVLGLSPTAISDKNKSGATILSRPISVGAESVQTEKSEWPLTQPMPKLEALIQCSGEAQFANDIPTLPGELHAAIVISDRGPGDLVSVDPSEALKIPGVVAFYSAKDIPGQNLIVVLPGIDNEQLFATDKIIYAGMRIGVIVAESASLATEAASKVKLEIKMSGKPVVSPKEVVKSGDKSRLSLQQQLDAKTRKTDVKHKIKGSYKTEGQYHYHMELHTCLVVPSDIGLDIYSATQWPTLIQGTATTVLGIAANEVNLRVKRLGGGFGGKFSNANKAAGGCMLAAYKLNRPVRMVVPMETGTESFGKRAPMYAEYEVEVNDNGEIQYLDANLYSDCGFARIEPFIHYMYETVQNNYNTDTWNIKIYATYTNTASNTVMRAPGATEAVAFMENLMEHIAAVVNKSSIDVRIANLKSSDYDAVTSMIKDVKESSDFENRKAQVDKFNKENRWKKRGIAFSHMTFLYEYDGPYHIVLSVYYLDGSIAITHGGIEMGQGINTKVAQVIARILSVDVNTIKIKPFDLVTSPNDQYTGADAVTLGVCYAAQQCSNILLERLKPFRTSDNTTWQAVITAAYMAHVDLCVEYMYSQTNIPGLSNYPIYGETVTEVEVDILTGQLQVLRVDMIEDAGISLNPDLDIGQIQGAFVMGLGYWLTEQLIYDENTGQLLTNRSWNYTPPMDRDIPIDFRIQLRKNAPNPLGVLRSKSTGEPPLCCAVCVTFAIKNALLSARNDAGVKENWFNFDMPYTPEFIQLQGLTNVDQFTL